ncbi:unnamed protein product [Lactuca virosa]|uniref:Uncharacterized protein n=1 Tax=Lactuca virosa TaxID=75947 RepID=A0AAU9NMD6_9ASTR|nr:unnamed protein product [Lactuca virosa]
MRERMGVIEREIEKEEGVAGVAIGGIRATQGAEGGPGGRKSIQEVDESTGNQWEFSLYLLHYHFRRQNRKNQFHRDNYRRAWKIKLDSRSGTTSIIDVPGVVRDRYLCWKSSFL